MRKGTLIDAAAALNTVADYAITRINERDARITRLEDALNHLLNAVQAGASPDLRAEAIRHANSALEGP